MLRYSADSTGRCALSRIFPAYPRLLRYAPVFQFLLDSRDHQNCTLHIIFNTLKFNIMAYEKIYIGKGTQVPNLQIAKVTLKLEEVEKIAYERDGVKYVTFEVARLREPDKFGRTHTCYFSQKVAEPVAPQQSKPKGKKKRARKEEPELI